MTTMELHKKYETEEGFRHLVNQIYEIIQFGHHTIEDIKDAATLAVFFRKEQNNEDW